MISDIDMDYVSEMLYDWRSVLPASILSEAELINKEEQDRYDSSESFAVGFYLRSLNLTAKYPIITIPGVISTGLESWYVDDQPNACATKANFRQRLWGSWSMIKAMFMDKQCWLNQICLDPETGMDPPGAKLRAAQGFEASDFFITGYWIWNKLLENLAALHYDPNNMFSAAYDWRLAYSDIEKRDHYFTRMKTVIEHNLKFTGEKTILVSHSMGSQIAFYFMKWVEAEGYGNGGKRWVNDHIEAFVDISGCLLGTPKSIVALMSGEMRDTVQLNPLAVYGLEKFFSRSERAYMLRTFGGIPSMIPKGGSVVWGGIDSAPDDAPGQNNTFGKFIAFEKTIGELSSKNLTVEGAMETLFKVSPEWFKKRVLENYSWGLATTTKQLKANEKDPSKWTNPLEVALPYAPDMKLYHFYGIGKPTERSYWYEEIDNKTMFNLDLTIDKHRADSVLLGEGDGTISLLTHSICHIWKRPNSIYNPGGSKVTIVEMKHEPDLFDMRGGAKTAEHVDILGRGELNEMVIRVAAGKGDEIPDRIISNIEQYVEKMGI
ncbi:hypothetical protein CANCADRAFT_26813 [Tortispora caseinolytica NRRL Y-17796]|uniref:Phospholipid:diacylglycerol acyltransferase n=1 Tax=Tortispora caseinolytica NRRL Y-17796 TaxID=767744 RepID=A0A1E4TEF4_9ASCO|nr:hypothetical protein CANCADRAFT_26813 [Tortispora caseinolytica NRRL Y-17796]